MTTVTQFAVKLSHARARACDAIPATPVTIVTPVTLVGKPLQATQVCRNVTCPSALCGGVLSSNRHSPVGTNCVMVAHPNEPVGYH